MFDRKIILPYNIFTKDAQKREVKAPRPAKIIG